MDETIIKDILIELENNKKQLEELNKQIIKLEKTNENLRTIVKKHAREEQKQNLLKFKDNVVQKASNAKAKIGSVKNSVLKTCKDNLHKINNKIANAFKQAGIKIKFGVATVGYGVTTVSDGIAKFTSEQIQNFKNFRKLKQRQKYSEGSIKFQKNKVQKASNAKAKLGSVKKNVLNNCKTNLHNMDVKIKNVFEKAGIKLLEGTTSVVKGANNFKQKVIKFKSDQILKYKNFKEEQRRKSIEKIKQDEEKQQEKENRKLKFKENSTQKANFVKAKVCTIQNFILRNCKLNLNNMDVKIKNAFEKVGIKVLEGTTVVMKGANNVKEKVLKFKSDQIQKYREHKAEREKKVAEEREEYQKKHEENVKKRNEILAELKMQKENLFHTYSINQQTEENTQEIDENKKAK